MMRARAGALAVAAVLCAVVPGAPVQAVQPDEVLADPGLEARARALSRGLRCPVCRNESIDESNADISRDIRILLRERLTAGDSDEEAVGWLVDRYGEYVLLTPDARGANIVLWLAAPGLLLGGGIIAALYLRGRGRSEPPADLTPEESAHLSRLMSDRLD